MTLELCSFFDAPLSGGPAWAQAAWGRLGHWSCRTGLLRRMHLGCLVTGTHALGLP